jgi:subtilase family serine protease
MKYRSGAIAPTLLGAALALSATAPMAAASASHVTVHLRNSASPAAARTRQVGRVPGSSAVSFQVVARLVNAKQAAALATAVSTPGNRLYHHFLTAGQWEQRFAPSAATVARIRAFLKGSGFRVGKVPADRLFVPATGTARQVERAFNTSLAYHQVQGQRLRLASRGLSIPAHLAGLVSAVVGVSQTPMKPNRTTGSAARARQASATPNTQIPQPAGFRVAPPCGSYYNQKLDKTLPPYGNGYPATPPWAVCGYTGPQFRSAYGLSGPNTGRGVTVAIVDAYASPTLYQDAHEFAAINDPSRPLTRSQFAEFNAKGFNDVKACDASGWFGEQTLDVEAVHNTAPGANILFAGAKNCEQGLLNSLNQIVQGHLASVITNSYGDNAGDLLDSASDRQAWDSVLQMADATGISVLFSSGDNGDEFTTVGAVTPDYPATSPYATAVGGTTLQIGSSGQRLGENGWSTARSFLCNATYASLGGCTTSQEGTWLPIDEALDGGSGGGTSYVYPQPSYQRGVVPGPLARANGRAPMRVVPDVSMEADPATGMLVGETQTFPDGTYYDQYRIGGTSVASPLLAGVIARADQTAHGSIGFVNPALYSLHGNSAALYDVGPAGKQDQSRADYANSIDSSQGFLYTTRIIDYEGTEQFCASATSCSSRQVALHTAPGYDNMTGLGAPSAGFVGALAAASGK